jgi:exopolysaccharide biosynthesis polyprenyl glycosylphosphotransferase
MAKEAGSTSVKRTLLALLVGAVDVGILNVSNYLAFLIRFRTLPLYNWLAYQRLLPWEAFITLTVFYFYGLYHYANKTSAEMRSAVVTAVLLSSFVTMASSYLLVNIGFPRSVFFISMVFQIVLFGLWHLLHRSYMLRTAPARRVVVVGPEAEWPQLARRAGQFLPRISIIYARPEQAQDAEVFQRADAVIVGHVDRSRREQYFLHAMRRGIPCLWIPDTYDVLVAGAELTSLDDSPMFSLPSAKVRGGSRAFKRLADILVSAVGLVMAAPLMAAIALAIYAESGSPVLYRQERVTSGGRVFQLLKFRTMVPDAETLTGPVLATADDPRITPVGKVLRASHLDELPQLWNILAGDMSLVGPRPERPVFVDDFSQRVPHYPLRLLTPPGLTGLAQVSGRYHSTPEEKAIYDWHYAKTWSWLKDLSIVIQTVLQLFQR